MITWACQSFCVSRGDKKWKSIADQFDEVLELIIADFSARIRRELWPLRNRS